MPDAGTTPTPIGRTLITGGASGLGAAVADAVAGAGGTPIVLDVQTEGSPYAAYRGDVTRTREVEALVARIAEEHGGLDAVVTAAGIDRPGRLDEIAGVAVQHTATLAGLVGMQAQHNAVLAEHGAKIDRILELLEKR